jgi:hypothetical protein
MCESNRTCTPGSIIATQLRLVLCFDGTAPLRSTEHRKCLRTLRFGADVLYLTFTCYHPDRPGESSEHKEGHSDYARCNTWS